jgi:hypothetical protein
MSHLPWLSVPTRCVTVLCMQTGMLQEVLQEVENAIARAGGKEMQRK